MYRAKGCPMKLGNAFTGAAAKRNTAMPDPPAPPAPVPEPPPLPVFAAPAVPDADEVPAPPEP